MPASIFPGVWRIPGAYSRVQPGGPQGVGERRVRALLTGVRLSAGTVAALTPVQVTAESQAADYFGEGSQLAAMVRAFKAGAPTIELWAVGQAEDGAGVAATQTITITGTATEAGTIPLMIAGVAVPVAVAKDDAQNTIAAAVTAAITAKTRLPVSAGAAANVVTATCKWKGANGNDVDIRVGYYQGERVPAGVTVAIAAGVTGTTDPDIADVIAALPADMQFDIVVIGSTASGNLTALKAELLDRASSIRGIPGQAFVGFRDTYANTQALTDAHNSQFLTIGCHSTIPHPSWEAAAADAAAEAIVSDLNAPRLGDVLVGILPPEAGEGFTQEERNLLLQDGGSTYVESGGFYVVERRTTTYQTTDGAEDASYLDIGTARVLNFLRADLRDFLVLRFRKHKLGPDGTQVAPGVRLATPKDVRLAFGQRLLEHEALGYLTGTATTAEEASIELSATPGRVDLVARVIVVQGLHQFALDLAFSI